jgi:hypothetical protein
MIPVPPTLKEGTDNHRLFLALRSGQPQSHHTLYGLHMIVHSRASDLRLKHGCLIDTWRDGKTTWYQLRAVRESEAAASGADGASPLGPPNCPPGDPEPAASSTPPSPRVQPVQPKQLSVFEAAA